MLIIFGSDLSGDEIFNRGKNEDLRVLDGCS